MKELFSVLILLSCFAQITYAKDYQFVDKFIEFANNDKVIDKSEFEELKRIIKLPHISDKKIGSRILEDLEKYQNTTEVTYTIRENRKDKVLVFTLAKTYNESDFIIGKNPIEIISNISQSDTLAETFNDSNRCGSASILNAFILQGGNFAYAAYLFGIDQKLTYENVHKVQEELYKYSNINGNNGLDAEFRYSHNKQGKILEIQAYGEVVKAAHKLKMKVEPILGKSIQTLFDRREIIQEYFKNNEKAVLLVGVYLEKSTGKIISPVNPNQQNHFILIFKDNNNYYLADTGQSNNGNRSNVKKLSDSHLNQFVYNTKGVINTLEIVK